MLLTTQLTDVEFAKLKSLQASMGAKDLGVVLRAAIDAFTPGAAAPAAPVLADAPIQA